MQNTIITTIKGGSMFAVSAKNILANFPLLSAEERINSKSSLAAFEDILTGCGYLPYLGAVAGITRIGLGTIQIIGGSVQSLYFANGKNIRECLEGEEHVFHGLANCARGLCLELLPQIYMPHAMPVYFLLKSPCIMFDLVTRFEYAYRSNCNQNNNSIKRNIDVIDVQRHFFPDMSPMSPDFRDPTKSLT